MVLNGSMGKEELMLMPADGIETGYELDGIMPAFIFGDEDYEEDGVFDEESGYDDEGSYGDHEDRLDDDDNDYDDDRYNDDDDDRYSDDDDGFDDYD